MYLLPIFLKKYKTSASMDCIVRKVRANTIYQYNNNGYLNEYNPNDLLVRDEKNKGIYLKDQRDLKTGYGGGTTAIFVEVNKNGDNTINTVSYYGWQQSIVLLLLIGAVGYITLFSQEDLITVIIGLIVFNGLFALTSYKTLRKQRELIESIITSCQEKD